MRLALLGPLCLTHSGREVIVNSARARTALALLGLNPGRTVSFDELISELWAGRPIRDARNALHATIARLRRLLASIDGGEDVIRTASGGYVFELPSGSIDVQRFEALSREGAALIKQEPHQAIEALREALALWRGPALADVSEGVRCRTAAVYLDEQRLTTEEDLLASRLAIGEEWLATSDLKQLVAEHPGRERLSEYLMLALYRSGRQSEAISVFQRTCNWLSNELGLQPGRPLQELYQAILLQSPSLDHRTDSRFLGTSRTALGPPVPRGETSTVPDPWAATDHEHPGTTDVPVGDVCSLG